MRAPSRGHGAVAHVGRGKGSDQTEREGKVEPQQVEERDKVERQGSQRQHATPDQGAQAETAIDPGGRACNDHG